jgi:hypothetical protein
MTSRNIRHRVIRTCNRHSRAVLKGDTVVIRLARNLSRTEERDHIQDLLRRMTRIVLEERRKVIVDPFRALFQGEDHCTVTLATGKRIVFSLTPGPYTRARKTRRGWQVTVAPQCRKRELHRFLWKLLSIAEQRRVAELVERINRRTLRVRIRGVRLLFTSSQWGSFSPRGIIAVNTALLLLPPRLLRYIIVHELSHRIRPDHSPAFWRTVEGGMPRYQSARRELLEYRLPQLEG